MRGVTVWFHRAGISLHVVWVHRCHVGLTIRLLYAHVSVGNATDRTECQCACAVDKDSLDPSGWFAHSEFLLLWIKHYKQMVVLGVCLHNRLALEIVLLLYTRMGCSQDIKVHHKQPEKIL